MTDRQPTDLRTARAHYNGDYYTVSLDHWAVDTYPENVHWLTTPDNSFLSEPLHRVGVLLVQYQVAKDDDPTWRAEIQLGVIAGLVCITAATITADKLDKTTLPLAQLLRACLRVGGVVGTMRDVVGEQSGLTIRTYQYSAQRDADGELFHPDEIHKLTGQQPPKKRGYRNDPETLQAVWDAVTEYQRLRNEQRANGLGKLDETQNEWVARECGLPVSNVHKQIAAARKKYKTTNTRGKK
jgi:hypothetical protein